jgi:hypothetical protein
VREAFVCASGGEMIPFDDNVKTMLSRSGWFPGRLVDTNNHIREATSSGFCVSDKACEILSEFGGLAIRPLHGEGLVVSFRLDLVAHSGGDRRFEYLRGLVGEDMCPVAFADQTSVLVTPSDRIIWLNDDWILFILFGSFAEFLAFVCSGESREPTWLDQQLFGHQVWKADTEIEYASALHPNWWKNRLKRLRDWWRKTS